MVVLAHMVVFNALEKMKCIFSIAPVESLEKSRECFSLEKYSPDAGLEGTRRWPRRHQTLLLHVQCALVSGRGEGSTGRSASEGSQTLLALPVMHDISSESASVSD